MKLSAQEKKWQAESDARTMAEYQNIMQDNKRKSAAMKAARRQAEDLTKRLNAMKLASGGKLRK